MSCEAKQACEVCQIAPVQCRFFWEVVSMDSPCSSSFKILICEKKVIKLISKCWAGSPRFARMWIFMNLFIGWWLLILQLNYELSDLFKQKFAIQNSSLVVICMGLYIRVLVKYCKTMLICVICACIDLCQYDICA